MSELEFTERPPHLRGRLLHMPDHYRHPIDGNCNAPVKVESHLGGGTRPCRAPGSFSDGKCYHHTLDDDVRATRKRQKLHRDQHAAAQTHAYPVTLGMVMRMPVKEYLLLSMVADALAVLPVSTRSSLTPTASKAAGP